MKILLLGKDGMLGSALLREITAIGEVGLVALSRSECDIADAASLTEAIDREVPDLVANCAAYTDVNGAEDNEVECMTVNGTSVGVLAKICAERDVRFMHFSTDYVFKGVKPEGYSENDELDGALSVYGHSKALGERLIRESGCRAYIVRSSWLYGPGGKNFVDTVVNKAQELPELRVVNDQHGNPTYVEDLAMAAVSLIKDKADFGTYHLVNESATNWYDFAREILHLKGISTPVVPISSELMGGAKRPAYAALNNTLRPKLRPWKTALKEYLKTK